MSRRLGKGSGFRVETEGYKGGFGVHFSFKVQFGLRVRVRVWGVGCSV